MWESLPLLSICGDQIAQCLGWSKRCHQLSSHGPRGLQSFCDFNSKIPAFFPSTFRILHREKKIFFFWWLRISEEVFTMLWSCIKNVYLLTLVCVFSWQLPEPHGNQMLPPIHWGTLDIVPTESSSIKCLPQSIPRSSSVH